MDIKFIIALIGLTGVVVSALVQYYLGRQAESNKKTIEIRTNAYLDFVNSVSEIASSAQHNQNRSLNQLQKLNQAKTRVVLIGSDEVVNAIHTFWSKFGSLDSEDAISSFSIIISAMRKDLSGGKSLPNDILKEALFNKKQSNK